MAILPGAWRYRVSAGTGRPGVSILWLGEVESLICNFSLSVAARKLVWADPSLRYTSMLLGRSATNQQTNKRQWLRSERRWTSNCLFSSWTGSVMLLFSVRNIGCNVPSTLPRRWPGGMASATRASGLDSIPAFSEVFFQVETASLD